MLPSAVTSRRSRRARRSWAATAEHKFAGALQLPACHDRWMSATDLSVLKLHRRTLLLDGRAFTILAPRPAQPERLATNSFHQTWHVLADPFGGRFFAEC